MKKLKWIALGLVAVVVIVLAIVYVNLNSIVKVGVEKASTQALGLDSTLGSATVSLFGGSVGLHDFAIASPQGFDAPKFLEVGGLSLAVSVSELRQTPIRISSIQLSKPKLVVEQKDMKLNLSAVNDALPKTDPNAAPPPKLVIGEVKVEAATVVIRPGFPGLSQEITVTLPDIVVKDIGTGSDAQQNGVAIKEVLMTVATAMADKAMDDDRIPPELRTLLKGDLSGLKAQFGKQIQQLQDDMKGKAQEQIDQAKDKAKEKTEELKKKAEKGLGDLLKKP